MSKQTLSERLREQAHVWSRGEVLREAADRIDELEAELGMFKMGFGPSTSPETGGEAATEKANAK